jgi:hypothetical protein
VNIQEYISSGIIQSCVLGLADDAERAEFERMCGMYPEVKEARVAFEIALEEQAMFNQLQPPSNLKSKIFAGIDIEKDQEDIPVIPKFSVEQRRDLKTRPAKVVAMSSNWHRYVSAAAVILLLISTGLNFYFFNKSKQYRAIQRAVPRVTGTAKPDRV